MSPCCNVYLLPALATKAELAGTTAVVIDVLRATTTIVHALAAGASSVVPVLSLEEAWNLAAKHSQVLLGGERGGERIEGFHLGNSPGEYTTDRVGGKTLVFTTTNGTKAMRHAEQASRMLLGAFVNFSAICRELRGASQISIVCAGTDGQITREDTLLAGAIVDDLMRSRSCAEEMAFNDQAEIAADAWRALQRDLAEGKPLAAHLRSSQGARNLIELGMERDIDIAATIDRFDLIPIVDLVTWQIKPMS